jgi:predicted AlkP superfamily pyrophosphatase or phosphodiesterase
MMLQSAEHSARERRAVIVVCDGLRRDLIDPYATPSLTRFARCAMVFSNARGIFPSLTRVSAASIATGCYPRHHGLLGNTMALNDGSGLACYSAGEPTFRDRLRSVTGRTLWRPTLAEHVKNRGGAVALSNVSPGGAYFLDPDCHGHVYHRAGSYAPGGARLSGSEVLEIEGGPVGDAAMTKRFCEDVLVTRGPALGVLWLSEPDWTGHLSPLGSPEYKAALRAADQCVQQVLDVIDRLDPEGERILRSVCSDYGAMTVSETIDVAQALAAAGLKESRASSDVVVAPNGTAALIFISREARSRMGAVAEFLRQQPWVGRVFAGDELRQVQLPSDGDLVVAITLRADSEPNRFGVPGHSAMAWDPDEPTDYTGHGMHGGLGHGEQQPFLFVGGGHFGQGSRARVVSLVDIAPTVLRHLGAPVEGMDGQPLQQLVA